MAGGETIYSKMRFAMMVLFLFFQAPMVATQSDPLEPPAVAPVVFIQSCTSVDSTGHLTVPAWVTSIGDNAFAFCQSLKTISFAQGSQITRIGLGAFFQSGLTSITIPSSVIDIYNMAFYYCRSLSTVTFENSSQLKNIGILAFSDTALTSISIPASVAVLGNRAFQNSPVSTVTYDCFGVNLFVGVDAFSNTQYAASGRTPPVASCRVVEFALICSDVGSDGQLTIGASVTAIDDDAFIDCSTLTSVVCISYHRLLMWSIALVFSWQSLHASGFVLD